eukprot:scaffold4.g5054.t1
MKEAGRPNEVADNDEATQRHHFSEKMRFDGGQFSNPQATLGRAAEPGDTGGEVRSPGPRRPTLEAQMEQDIRPHQGFHPLDAPNPGAGVAPASVRRGLCTSAAAAGHARAEEADPSPGDFEVSNLNSSLPDEIASQREVAPEGVPVMGGPTQPATEPLPPPGEHVGEAVERSAEWAASQGGHAPGGTPLTSDSGPLRSLRTLARPTGARRGVHSTHLAAAPASAGGAPPEDRTSSGASEFPGSAEGGGAAGGVREGGRAGEGGGAGPRSGDLCSEEDVQRGGEGGPLGAGADEAQLQHDRVQGTGVGEAGGKGGGGQAAAMMDEAAAEEERISNPDSKEAERTDALGGKFGTEAAAAVPGGRNLEDTLAGAQTEEQKREAAALASEQAERGPNVGFEKAGIDNTISREADVGRDPSGGAYGTESAARQGKL